MTGNSDKTLQSNTTAASLNMLIETVELLKHKSLKVSSERKELSIINH
jgi:hypothetical protein